MRLCLCRFPSTAILLELCTVVTLCVARERQRFLAGGGEGWMGFPLRKAKKVGHPHPHYAHGRVSRSSIARRSGVGEVGRSIACAAW